MDIQTYRRTHKLSQAAFASLLTAAGCPATQGLISQWESGSVSVPAERCRRIESATGGAIRPIDLRPDVFGPTPPADSEAA
ncbi:helix-turn-helix domain-containing protein [Lysobacter sp. 5GHs7-4]|uniref:transcriptional regulator n=1 Tax=Lysobacter sp. 5GHs7-4 TaxID=2904253 RepID=UPI001E55501F|nr:YdaS family helix-turn-helix protein [Lysobacter sp. 5GHs7-4]UHQ21919.1 helix-turn-helix domain-containing protein [Lysobacter sp. 5GHs7-4]